MLEFIYNGVSSRDIGIMVNKINHHDILSEERIEKGSFPRINGVIYNDSNLLESYTLEIECTLYNKFTLEDISRIKRIFSDRDGELIINNKPNHILKVKLISSVQFTKLFGNTGSFILRFEVDPLSYLKSGFDWVQVSSGSKLINIGNVESKPCYKITSSGAKCTLTVNGVTMEFNEVKDTFIVDTNLEDVHGENGENLNKYMSIESDFVGLTTGDNVISFVGINKLEIMPRWADQ